ncbi:MAG: outer membrane protein assembly factor BamA, partial [Bradymonadia bacterium]
MAAARARTAQAAVGWRRITPWAIAPLTFALLTIACAPAVAQVATPKASLERAQAIRIDKQSVDGQILVGYTVVCDVAECGDPGRIAVLRKATGLRIGLPLRPDDLAEGWLRLMRTGLFSDVTIKHLRRGVGLTVTFKATTAVIITDLEIAYAESSSWLYPRQFRSEIRKRLIFHKGGPFPARPKDKWAGSDAALIEQQRRKIVRLYRQLGYRGAQVKVEPTWHGAGEKQVRLRIVITEGSQPPIGQVLVRGNEAFDHPQVVSYFATGERVDFWRDLFGVLGLGRYSRTELREDVKLLELAYREKGYVSARVRQEGVACRTKDVRAAAEDEARCAGKVYPLLSIREGDKVTVEFDGNTRINDDALQLAMTFSENGAFDAPAIKDSISAIEEAYQAQAYYYVQVTAESEQTGPKQTLIRFTIVEGRPVYVREVKIRGLAHLTEEEVVGVMATRGIAADGVIATFGASAGVIQDAQVVNDLLAIRGLYYDKGYPLAKFRCAQPGVDPKAYNRQRLLRAQAEARQVRDAQGADAQGADVMGPAVDPLMFRGAVDQWTSDPVPTRCFVVEPDADPRLVTLHFEIDEGERTTIDLIDIGALLAGIDVTTRDEIYDLLIKLGFLTERRRWVRRAGLNVKKIQSIRSILLRYFHQEGYLQAQVVPVCFGETGGPMVTADCTPERLYGAHLDALRFEIEEGPRTEVNGILLRGNLTTQEHIIRRELLLEDGGALGTEALFRSQANLRSLSLFEAASVSAIGRVEGGIQYEHSNPSTVKVVIEEGRYQQVDAVIGLQIASSPLTTDELPVLYTVGSSWRQRNLFGRAIEVGVGANHANRIDTPQDISGDFASWEVGPFVKDRRLFGTKIDLAMTATFEQGRTAQRDAYQQLFSAEAVFGYDFYNLSYPAPWGRGLRTTVSVEWRQERRRLLTQLDERPPFGDLNDSIGLAPALVWERRDNPLNPTRGWFAS